MDISWAVIGPMLMGGGAVMVWWFVQQVYKAVDRLRADVERLQTSLPGTYARRDEMQNLKREIIDEIRELKFYMTRHIEESTQRALEFGPISRPSSYTKRLEPQAPE